MVGETEPFQSLEFQVLPPPQKNLGGQRGLRNIWVAELPEGLLVLGILEGVARKAGVMGKGCQQGEGARHGCKQGICAMSKCGFHGLYLP